MLTCAIRVDLQFGASTESAGIVGGEVKEDLVAGESIKEDSAIELGA